jgi:L-malate glycosyltransferase
MPAPVLLIGDTLHRGGTESQFVEIACGLSRARWSVHVACLRPEGPLAARLDAAGLPAWRCGPASLKSPRFAVSVLRLVRWIRRHRIAICHSFDFYTNRLAVVAGRLARQGIVIASQRDLGNLLASSQQRVQEILVSLADAVTVNSPAIAERLISRGIVREDRVIVVQNGVDLRRFRPAQEGSPRAVTRVVSIGNLRPEKGHDDLVKAAGIVQTQIPAARFDVWGEGPSRPTLEGLTRQAGLSSIVRFRGSTAIPETVLRNAEIFVLPSVSEATSNALLEAMASGLPVVATRVGGTPWLVEDEVSGLLVPPRDPAALGKAIIRLIEQPALARALGQRAAQLAQARFGLDSMVTSIETGYARLLAQRRR